jgi:hypothetical protein
VEVAKYRPLRSTDRTELFFERPIFDWTGVVPKFFGMIFARVGAKIPVNPKEFSAVQSANVGEVQIRYNVYGGPSSISMFADRLCADFPVLTPSDYPLVRDLLKTVHDGFASEFPNCPISRIEHSSWDHIEILPPHTVKAFLAQHRFPRLDETFKTEAITEPGIKFSVKGTMQPWEYAVMAEQSLFHAAALFVSHTLKLHDVSKVPTFEDKVALAFHVEELTLKALGLERTDVTST